MFGSMACLRNRFPVLPNKGMFTFDYIRVRPREQAKHCKRSFYSLDLSLRAVRCAHSALAATSW